MSYVVLARKWRPMKFEDVVSQDHVSTTLKNAILNDRLASAYLFSGPRGVGKTTTARIFAKAVNCDKGPTPDPCNTCASCKEITESRSLDVFEIDGASNRGIDEVRNLRENLKYAASKGKHKIYIIDEVHMLTTEAFNALLKTLEEPPPNVFFIFATTEFHKVPATILSRCQRYDFRRIPPNEIAEKLRSICDAEKVTIDVESLYLIARKADGSLRDSQSLLDQVISFCGNEIKLSDLTDLLGVIDQEFFFECSDTIARRDVDAGLNLVEKVFSQGYDMGEFLGGLAEHFRNMLVVKATGKTDLLEGLETYKKRYENSLGTYSDTDFLRLIQIASDAAFQTKRSTNPKLMLEIALIKMTKMDTSVDLGTLISSINNPGQLPGVSNSAAPQSGDAPVSAKTKATAGVVSIRQLKPTISEPVPAERATAPVNGKGNGASDVEPLSSENAVVSLEKVKAEWPRILDQVKAKKIHLGSFLSEGYPTAVTDSQLEISFGKGSGFHLKTVEQNRGIVQEVVAHITGFKLGIRCHKNESKEFSEAISVQRSDTPVQVLEATPGIEPEQRSSDDDVLEIPIVKRVIEIFDGEVVEDRKGATM